MAVMPLAEQDRLIRRAWPFRTILLGNGMALWRGTVTALSCPYDVSIFYVPRRDCDTFTFAHADFPEVRVHSPPVTRRAEEPDTPIPHVFDEGLVRLPPLCLFDPRERGWDASRAIADTTIPWIADWLRFYEAWQATGHWAGGGREHDRRVVAGPSGRCPRRLTAAIDEYFGMGASRAVITTAEARAAAPVARAQLADHLQDIPFDAVAAGSLSASDAQLAA